MVSGDARKPIAEIRSEYAAKRAQKLEKLFGYIAAYIRSNKCPPSYKEMAQHMGCSKTYIVQRIDLLIEQGRLTVQKGFKRSIRIAEGQGHDDLIGIPYLTEERKLILKAIADLSTSHARYPSVSAVAARIGISPARVRRHVAYLEEVELVRYLVLFKELQVTKPSDYISAEKV